MLLSIELLFLPDKEYNNSNTNYNERAAAYNSYYKCNACCGVGLFQNYLAIID